MAQFIAVMPLYGITQPAASALKFTWINIRTFHNLFILLLIFIMAILSIIWGTSNKLSLKSVGTKINYEYTNFNTK